jgi:hypothetical protein
VAGKTSVVPLGNITDVKVNTRAPRCQGFQTTSISVETAGGGNQMGGPEVYMMYVPNAEGFRHCILNQVKLFKRQHGVGAVMSAVGTGDGGAGAGAAAAAAAAGGAREQPPTYNAAVTKRKLDDDDVVVEAPAPQLVRLKVSGEREGGLGWGMLI